MDRRRFIHHSTALSLASIAAPTSFMELLKKKKKKIGIQLYSVRDDMANDAEGTLAMLAKMGYLDVESAGYKAGKYYDMKPADFKAVLDREGLKVMSGHTLTGVQAPDQKGTLINNWEMAVADAAAIGQKYMVCAYLQDYERKSIDDYKRLAELFNKSGEVCKQYGIQFAYHNHDFEFIELDGEIPYDVLLKETSPELMTMELDLYWIVKGRKNPFHYFKKHPGRFKLWHVKDMDATKEQFFTEVGNGIIDFMKIFQEEELAGMEYFYVEQDVCKNHKPLESVKISIDYLKKLRY